MKKKLGVLVMGLALVLGGCGGGGEDPQVTWDLPDDAFDGLKPPPSLTWCYEKDMYGNIWKKPCD